jgi:hypothetical protein
MKKNILHLRVISHIFLVGFLILFSCVIWNCKDDPTGPTVNSHAGIQGIVYDTSGHPLDSVRIFCLYYFNYYSPANTKGKSAIFRVNKPDTFGFNLYQNFPNPVQNTTFLRFSLPIACSTNISVTDRANGEVKYSYSDSLPEGLYQLYLNNLVDSLQLHNGPYTYSIIAKSTTGITYNASKELFVVSDVGSPNATTGTDGMYFFDYKNAFVGDSVAVYTNEIYPIYNVSLGKNITLLIERRGYYTQYYETYLNPNIQIHSDIIMTRNNK